MKAVQCCITVAMGFGDERAIEACGRQTIEMAAVTRHKTDDVLPIK